MIELMFHAGVKRMSKESELIPCHYTNLRFGCESVSP